MPQSNFDASKCVTVIDFATLMLQSVQLSSTLMLQCNFDASKCVTVIGFATLMLQSVQLSSTLTLQSNFDASKCVTVIKFATMMLQSSADGLETTTPYLSWWAGNYNPAFGLMGWKLQPCIWVCIQFCMPFCMQFNFVWGPRAGIIYLFIYLY